jgi:bla regulator protein BlaR1
MFRSLAAANIVLTTGIAFGQPPAAPPTFEVAAIKPSNPNTRDLGLHRTGGMFVATGFTLQRLIAFAYDVEVFQVSGGPAWSNSERYDITAKKASDPVRRAKPDDDKLRVQVLLVDRFKLVIHRESKELPVYALVFGKNGSKLQIAKPHVGSSGVSGRGGSSGTQWTFTDAPVSLLVHNLSQRLERPVVDRTGLSAHYDFKLEWTSDQSQPVLASRESAIGVPDSSGPSLFTALQEQLGLKLEAQKGPVEIIVIDRADRPSEN